MSPGTEENAVAADDAAHERHIVVVGVGLAGLRTAERLRRLGHTGTLTMVGAEPLAAYDRPPLSKAALAGAEPPSPTMLRLTEGYAELDVDLLLGVAATGLDPERRELRLDDGRTLGFDDLVIATGARAHTVPAWAALPRVHTLRTFDDLGALREDLDGARSLAVIGAGVLGCEIAASARARGLEVHLVDVEPRPLARVAPPAVGALLAEVHAEHGVVLHLGEGVDDLTSGPEGRPGVRLVDGTEVAADAVVVAIGSRPHTEWLDGSGLELGDGVLVDARGATSHAGVWAVGDVAAPPRPGGSAQAGPLRLEHWTAAGESAARVAAHLLGEEPAGGPDVPYVWSDQYDLKVQTLGLPEPDDQLDVVAGSLAERRFLAVLSHEGRVSGAVGIGMPAAVVRCRSAVADGEPLADLLERAPWQRRKAGA